MTIKIGNTDAYVCNTSVKTHLVPTVIANAETLQGYGTIIKGYTTAKVEILTWPAPGWRPVDPGTGNQGGVTEGTFNMVWNNNEFHARNHAVDGHYITGWFTNPSTPEKQVIDHSHVFTREANYHADGGQIFYPLGNQPFVLLLALPGDDITVESFTAFFCDGTFGVHVNSSVWHQPPYPINNNVVFNDKQGKVHSCISCDFVNEFNTYLEVSLQDLNKTRA